MATENELSAIFRMFCLLMLCLAIILTVLSFVYLLRFLVSWILWYVCVPANVSVCQALFFCFVLHVINYFQ